MSCRLTVANFLLALEREIDWKTLGIYLDIEQSTLDEIESLYECKGIRRCKQELFKALQRRREKPTWEDIAEALDKLRNHALAKDIREKYVCLSPDMPICHKSPIKDISIVTIDSHCKLFVDSDLVRELERLHSKFAKLVDDVRKKFEHQLIAVESLKTYCRVQLQLELPSNITTNNEIFKCLCPFLCFIKYFFLEDLVDAFLGDCRLLKRAFRRYKKELEKFKKLAPMKLLCSQMLSETPKVVRNCELKLMEFWSNVTVERFERLVNYLFRKPHSHLGEISVKNGCVLIEWIVVPEIPIFNIVTDLACSNQFMTSVGVVSFIIDGISIFEEDKCYKDILFINNALVKALQIGSHDAVRLLLSVIDFHIDAQAYMYEQNQTTATFIASAHGHLEVISVLLEYGANPNISTKDGTTPLMIASCKGHVEVVKYLLDVHVDVNTEREDGATALYFACQNGYSVAVSALLQYGANANVLTKTGRTPLMIASLKGHLDIVECLLKTLVDVNVQTIEGATAIYFASQNGHSEVVSILLQYGANSAISLTDGTSPLIIASSEGHLKVVECLMCDSVDLDVQTFEFSRAIFCASENGHSAVVSTLLKYGANPNITTTKGRTPLMIASFKGHLQVVNCLLQDTDNVDTQVMEGQTALYFACQNGHSEVASILLKYGANPTLSLTNGISPLIIASSEGHLEVVECLLVNPSVALNVQAIDGSTAVFHACENGHLAVVSALLKYGTNPTNHTKKGITPLMIASSRGYPKIVECLLKAGVDANAQALKGATAIFFASKNGHAEVVSILLWYQANPSIPTYKGETPLTISSSKGHHEVVDCLLKNTDNSHVGMKESEAIYNACECGHHIVVAVLLKYGVSPNSITNGDTPLMIASSEGHLDIVKHLLTVNVDINAQAEDGTTAVYRASANGQSEVVSTLLKYGADPNIPARNGYVPIIVASYKGYDKVVECLLEDGVNINAQTTEGCTAIFCASSNGHSAVVSVLLKNGANPMLSTNSRFTPLLTACEYGHHEVIELLWTSGVDINDCGTGLLSPLNLAIKKNNVKTVETLLSLGAEPNSSMLTHSSVTEIQEILKNTVAKYELYSTYHYNIPTLSLMSALSMPTLDRSFVASYKSLKTSKSTDLILDDLSLRRTYSIGQISFSGYSGQSQGSSCTCSVY